ncbi:MAG: 50S ribosomal protein L11 methyltransferase [Alphaproteobacteria bacterium]|nr:50S ribosomal protein L11 methyltransferase [Alphaproteobacteria bacterium]
MLQTTFTAPKALADTLLALTETHPEITLDVGEIVPNHRPEYATHFTYTLWLPAGLEAVAQAAANQPLSFQAVDETIDYVAQTKALFPPLQIGPYFIARNEEPTPPGLIGLTIAPNRAFGSGEHATTTGCLLGYEWLLAQGHQYAHALDFGAGSGVLAIAAAKRQSTQALALDNDAPSVEICVENAALNGVAAQMTSQLAETPPEGQTFPLIFANILLHPLLELAEPLVRCLADTPGAALILSGFTVEQGPELAARYEALGLKRQWQHAHAGWLAEVWQRG